MGSKRTIPNDKINLRLILVSGKTLEYFFRQSDSAADITQHVYDNWPEGKYDRGGLLVFDPDAHAFTFCYGLFQFNGALKTMAFTNFGDESCPATNILRLIFQGRFLHGNVTLGALQLPLGKTTVMHLVAREHLPEPNNQGHMKKDKRGESSCSNCCVIV